MKYVTYTSELGARVGVIDGDYVYDAGFEGDMVAFIEAGAPAGNRTPVKDARLQAPLKPRSLRDFITFEGHLKTSYERLGLAVPKEWYEVPVYYKGMPDTVIGPGADIPWPSYSDYVDCELELAAVIGRQVQEYQGRERRRLYLRLHNLERRFGARCSTRGNAHWFGAR